MAQEVGIEEARKQLGDLADAARDGTITYLTRRGQRIAAIVPIPAKERTMTTTTSYGSWNRAEPASTTLADSVATALGGFAADFDVDAICVDYRAAINEALPAGVSLHGDEFYGPYPQMDIDLRAVVAGVDFWAIAERHDKTTA